MSRKSSNHCYHIPLLCITWVSCFLSSLPFPKPTAWVVLRSAGKGQRCLWLLLFGYSNRLRCRRVHLKVKSGIIVGGRIECKADSELPTGILYGVGRYSDISGSCIFLRIVQAQSFFRVDCEFICFSFPGQFGCSIIFFWISLIFIVGGKRTIIE